MTDHTMPPVANEEVTVTTLAEWFNVKKRMKADKATESLLRTKIFKFFFKDPKEGTNNEFNDDLLSAGFKIQAKVPVTRDVDEAALNSIKDKLAEAGIDLNKLLRYVPEVNIREYRKLTESQLQVFDQCLVIKTGTAQVEIVPKSSRDD